MKKKNNETLERRKYPRVRVPVLCRDVRPRAKKKPITNISLGGVRIYSDERMDAGQEVELEFFLPAGSTVRAKARVIWIKELPPGAPGIYDVGLEFLELSRKAEKELSQVLKT